VQRVLGAALVLARGAERPERAVVLLLLLLPLTSSSSHFITASSSASSICFFFTRFTTTTATTMVTITSTVMRRLVVSLPAGLFIFPLPSAAAVFPHRGRSGSLDAELLAAKRLGH
jgi:Zn-dependent protease